MTTIRVTTKLRALTALGGLAAALSLAALAGGPVDQASAGPVADPPNVILVTVDDQAMSDFVPEAMPRTFRFLVRRGTSFSRSFAAPPLCCPDRAGILTGDYPHNSGVLSNHPGYADLKQPENTLGAWMQSDGYTTGLIGKYLNGTSTVLGAQPAPGWDRWFGVMGHPSYYGSTMSDDGKQVNLGDRYLTTVEDRKAARFVSHSIAGGPFFLWLTPYAPHVSSGRDPHGNCDGAAPKPLGRDFRRYADVRLPKDPSFNERNVSDKPPSIRDLPRLSRDDIVAIKRRYRCSLASLRDVDRGISKLISIVRHSGELQNTAIIYTSDNGFYFGEHRITKGKGNMYEPALRVPLVAKLPKDVVPSQVSEVRKPVANIDIAPTILDLVGGQPCTLAPPECRTMDGRSWLGLATGSTTGWPSDRGILVERGNSTACGFAGIRTRRYSMVISRDRNVSSGPCLTQPPELYDLKQDPFELHNLGDSSPAFNDLNTRLTDLRDCSGIQGRDPPPPSGHWCE